MPNSSERFLDFGDSHKELDGVYVSGSGVTHHLAR